MLDISDFPTRHPYTLGLWQNHIERILAGWVDELGVPIHRGVEVTGLVQDDDGVDVRARRRRAAARAVRRRRRRRAQRRSARRPASTSPAGRRPRAPLIAEVEVTEELPTGVTYDASGVHGLSVMEDGRTVRVVIQRARARATPNPRSPTSART